ncbi:MAG: hypothetical protein ACXVA2_09220 [Mucilaginibacter sp.]
MEKTYTLWQRITSATPSFFKKLQITALAIAGLGGTLATIPGVSPGITTAMISAGTAVAAIAQFAVKQFEPDDTTNETK